MSKRAGTAYARGGRAGGRGGRGGRGYGRDGFGVWDNGPLVRERIFVPVWVSMLESAARAVFRLLGRGIAQVVRHPIVAAVTVALAFVKVHGGWPAVAAVLAVALVVALVWRTVHRASWERFAVVPVRTRWRRWRVYRTRWEPALTGCGLVESAGYGEAPVVPEIERMRSHPDRDDLTVVLAAGQIPDDWTGASEALGHALGAWRVTIATAGPGRLAVTVLWSDPLADVLPITGPGHSGHGPDGGTDGPGSGAELDAAAVLDRLGSLLVGVTEDGRAWRLPLLPGRHLLVSGTTGAGKSSLLWAILWQARDLIAAGWVQVIGFDPKYVELAPLAESCLGTVHVHAAAMPEQLAGLVAVMDERLAVQGARRHTPSPASPVIVVVVDELATLTALADTKTKGRVDDALGHLLSRGRAAGIVVVLTSVEATKEVVRWRGLCSTRVCYRVDDDGAADLVLGDGARDRGAHAHLIPETTPGIAYVRTEGRRDITRVRTFYVTDTHLTRLGALDDAAEPVELFEPAVADTADLPVVTLPIPAPGAADAVAAQSVRSVS